MIISFPERNSIPGAVTTQGKTKIFTNDNEKRRKREE